MGGGAMLGLLFDAIDSVESFLQVFVYIYSLLILAYIITSWVRMPYSVWLNRIQRFLWGITPGSPVKNPLPVRRETGMS